ncbi:hypothetical protein IP90_01985 [Luteimonas cucumeris]|uniref:Glycosyl transferase family 2 n=2 Tax=Luteimonas cucumeris TaxID=985012 RepID=A0A562L5L2_9GAMM|nr:hypothetical protein IP90_01985 [Luteimonas cucumeris]
MALGARGFSSKIVFMDGDLVISPVSFAGFVAQAAREPILVGITPASSDQAVFAATENIGASTRLTQFTRETRMPFEWANVVSGPPNLMDRIDGYVFQQLEARLPLPAFALELSEVDTADDLQRAGAFAQGLTPIGPGPA